MILSLKLLSKFIDALNTDEESKKFLFETHNILELFCKNFSEYSQLIGEKLKNWTQDIDLLPLDNFTHTQHLKARLNFFNNLITQKVFDTDKFDPISFLYETLVVNGKSDKEKSEFYKWIKTIIDNKLDEKTEKTIFKLFNECICSDLKSIQHLTIYAFDSYLRVFLSINQSAEKLTYITNESKKIVILINSENKAIYNYSPY